MGADGLPRHSVKRATAVALVGFRAVCNLTNIVAMKPVLVLTCSLLFVLCRYVSCGRIPSGPEKSRSDLTRTILLQEDRRCEETEISKREVSAIGTKFPVGVKKRSVQRRNAPKIGAGGVLACPPGWIRCSIMCCPGS
ncbi:hypothetical protein EVAR_47941_1 [Eumeta japonica]|uniref:Uncharacterized protein n=1 Tax=Eumeta variegata TaxID=151549 RepID=A0A4C1Y3T6_EUMVA|nr:hypothetical protein EVAR_47941_1 [Eumeta japonica]